MLYLFSIETNQMFFSYNFYGNACMLITQTPYQLYIYNVVYLILPEIDSFIITVFIVK